MASILPFSRLTNFHLSLGLFVGITFMSAPPRPSRDTCALPLLRLFGTCDKWFVSKCLPVTPRDHILLVNRLGIPPNLWSIFPNSHLHTHKLVQGTLQGASLDLRADWMSRSPSNNSLGFRSVFPGMGWMKLVVQFHSHAVLVSDWLQPESSGAWVFIERQLVLSRYPHASLL